MAAGIGGAISGFGQIKQGKAMEKAGQEGIDNFAWQDLTNPYKDLAPSTAGAEMRLDASARTTANSVEALRGAGARGVIGGVGKVGAQSAEVARDVAANIDADVKDLQLKGAGQDVANQATIEKRQENELAGYGNMLDVGRDLRAQGGASLVAAAGSLDSIAMTAATGGFGGGKGMLGAIQPKV